jgi:3-deoxy-D-manno-octulosonic-acid transferase
VFLFGGGVNYIFFILYTLVSIILYIAALPFLFLFSFKSKYRRSVPARFWLWKNPPLRSEGICFHSCSFGEAKAIAPLVEALPSEVLRMTTTTQTGKEVTENYTDQSRYLPFEPLLLGWIRPQKALVVMEAEFWYLLFALAKMRGAKTMLINARMSDRSYPKYQRFGWFYRQLFKKVDEVYAQTILDKERLEKLGAQHITVTGNIKLARLPRVTQHWQKPSGLLLCAASTHEGEEGMILDAFDRLRQQVPQARIVVAPRHPERFEKVAQMITMFAQEKGHTWHRFSEQGTLESDIILLDVLGELVNCYAVSDIVILGGSFVPVGGHNAAEAAQFGCRILSGPHYFNQRDIYEAVEGIRIVDPENLSLALLAYSGLESTRIRYYGDVTPILESLNNVLYDQ